MSALSRTWRTGIGRKVLVGLTGLGLVGFLSIHMLGNLQIFKGDQSFNKYADGLHKLPGFQLIEIGLIAFFVIHMALVLWLALDNRAARGDQGYATSATKQKTSLLRVLASKTMVYSGIILVAFMVVHVMDFRLQHEAIAAAGGDLKTVVVTQLAIPWKALLYVAGSLLAAWHIFHGTQSAFRSVGFHHKKYTPIIEKIGTALAIILGLGFAAIPVYALLG